MSKTAEEGQRSAVGAIHTFLIADVRGYTRFTAEHGDEAAARLVAKFAALTRQIVSAHEGEVVELRGDEALAVFSSARQALRAAVALQEVFTEETLADTAMQLKVGIGLDAGEAVPLEGGYRGGALNLAARLCNLAGPGEILVSEEVTHLARKVEGLSYAERGAVELKGFDDLVRVVEVRPASNDVSATNEPISAAIQIEPASRELPIGGYLGSLPANRVVGRDAELAHTLDLIETVLDGTGRLLLLAGEPGAGKTRLAQEVTLHLRNRDFLIAAGRCYEPQQAVPFYPCLEALTALYAAAPADIRREVPARWSDLARLLPGLGLPVVDSAGAHDQQRLFWTVTGFVQALARRSPIALLLDDLHWADAASLELLQHLARHTHADRVLLLGTYRDVEVNRRHPLEAALRDLRREGLMERLEVRRLGREHTRELIAAVMGEEEVSDEFADLLYRRTEGNPFFVHQVLHVMVERGDVFRKDGRWDRKRIEELEVPESVRSVVGQRLSRLAEETQDMLREASVLGQTFSFDDLEAMSGRAEDELERCLEEAAAAGMVREVGRDRYGFDHALTQGALYAELSSRRRRRLHLAASEAIAALPEGRRQGRAAELAWHFLEGDDPERALCWSMIAGDGAERVFAHSDAEYHYRTALQLAEEEGNRLRETEAREKLGTVLSFMVRYDEALEACEAALRSYQEQGEFEGEIRLAAKVGWILFEQGRREEGMARLRPVLERWEREPVVSAGAASLHVALGNLYWHAGWLEDGLRLLERAVELAMAVGDDGLLGLAESRRGLFLEHLGRTDEALVAYGRSIPLLQAAADLQTLTRTFNNRALIYLDRGQSAEAWSDLERALEVARRLGDPSHIGWSLGVLAQARWAVDGDGKQTLLYAEEIMRLERQLRGTRASISIPGALWFRLVAGDELSALQELERLAGEAERKGDLPLRLWAQGYLAEWDLLQEREESALQRFEALLEHPEIESQYRPFLERKLSQVCVACGELERAERLISGQMEEESRRGWMHGRSQWLAIKGQLRAAQGRWTEARAIFEEALAFARKRRMALDLGETAHAYGKALAHRGETDAARERFEEALDVFKRMGAGPYIQRTQRALEALSSRGNSRKTPSSPGCCPRSSP